MSTTAVKCKYCLKEFSKNSYCNRHIKNVHKLNSDGELIEDKEKIKYMCVLCDKQYSQKWNLQRHIDAVHLPETIVYKCDKCIFQTQHKRNLNRHILKVHNRKKTAEHSQAIFQCPQCDSKYRHKKTLKYHERKIHNIGKTSINNVGPARKCPICKFQCYGHGEELIHKHFETAHGLSLKKKTLHFNNMSDFLNWKSDIEKRKTASFIKKYSSNSSSIYRCHRSGFYRKQGINNRHIKIMGSRKINAYCPSMMKVKKHKDNTITVDFISTHAGHSNDLKHVPLTKEERMKIAVQIASKKPHEEILKDIRASVLNCDLKRIHLMNKKDILNIEKSFNLNDEAIRHPFDPISIHAWVRDLKEAKDTAVLAYKPQGVLCEEFPLLKEEDFLLIYMSEAQKSILLNHGKDVLCIDGTHGLNNYSFQLYTLLTLDETREGFPSAFMFTNRGDETVLKIFFGQIKNELGTLNPQVFMSDMETTFYSAWEKVMGPSTTRLYCTWHVLKAWRKNINGKIKPKEKRESVYKVLQTVLYELDSDAFHKMLKEILERLKTDNDLLNFYDYFLNEYVQKEKYICWAYCYRTGAGINTNMSIENFNKILKYCYLKGKKIKRLDKTLCAILNLLRDKLFDLIVKVKKGKLVRKLQNLRKRHKHSLLLDVDKHVVQLTDDSWQILSHTLTEFYTVKRIKQCNMCQLQCTHCNSCFHEFICSCLDSSIRNNMCKHIHLIAKAFNSHDCDKVVSEANDYNLVMDDKEDVEQAVIREISQEEESTTFEIKKIKLHDELKNIEDNLETVEQVDYVRNHLRQIIPTLEAMKSGQRITLKVTSDERTPANANISQQRTFTMTRKRRQKTTTTLSKEERDKIACDLLLNNVSQ